LRLSRDGAVLRGQDRLIAAAGAAPEIPYALRFHLHPRITASPLYNGRGALLVGVEGVVAFEAGGLPVSIEESIFFAAPEGPRPCAQLVIHGHASDIAEISWSFRKQGGA
jgi:uncharacterized heparinase superfamily protein